MNQSVIQKHLATYQVYDIRKVKLITITIYFQSGASYVKLVLNGNVDNHKILLEIHTGLNIYKLMKSKQTIEKLIRDACYSGQTPNSRSTS
jgi:hypothetical protein